MCVFTSITLRIESHSARSRGPQRGRNLHNKQPLRVRPERPAGGEAGGPALATGVGARWWTLVAAAVTLVRLGGLTSLAMQQGQMVGRSYTSGTQYP